MRRKLLRTAILLLATVLVGCTLPPHRNPPPAYQSPVALQVLLPSSEAAAAGTFEEAAVLAATRLNTSRSPTERPVRVVIRPGAEAGVRAGPLMVYAVVDRHRGEPLIDPLLSVDAGETDDSAYTALAVYDAVLVAGLAARQSELPPADWLRSQRGWRLGLGMTHFHNRDTAPTGTRFEVR